MRVPASVRRSWPYAGLALAVVVATAGVVVVGANTGHPARDVRLLSGAAWLSSPKVGQVTLLDGTSAEVSAQVQVAAAGAALDVVQQGSTAYAVDQTAGTVRRVDGATFELTPPESPIPGAGAGLTVIPGADTLYTVDGRRGILAGTDPRTLSRRGELLPVASQLSAGTTTVDGAGRLWALDGATGDLTRVAGGKHNVARRVALPGPSSLVLTNGHPVVVDTTGRKAIGIDPDTARVTTTLDLDLREDDTVNVSGSARSERLYLVLGRGALVVCDVAEGVCDRTVPLDAANEFGAAVEAGNRLFVPDYTTGRVWIVDLTTSRVIAKPRLLTAAGTFQLLARDGVVFFNDLNSDRAGVVRLDGTVAVVAKYDADDPGKGLRPPPPPDPAHPQPPPHQPEQAPNEQPEPKDDRRSGEKPKQPPDSGPDPGGPVPDPEDVPAGTGDPPPAQLTIAMSDTSPRAGEPITLRVNNTGGPAPTATHWTFGDGEQGDGVTVSHAWTTARPGPYLVTATATMPTGQQATISANVVVTARPTVTVTVSIPGGGGTITGGGVACPGTCSAAVEPGTTITLTAAPDASHLPGTWAGACTGTQTRCELTVNADQTVGHTFASPTPKVTLTVAPPSGGTVTGDGISCPGTCAVTVDKGTRLRLSANPNEDRVLGSWGGACLGMSTTCVLTLDKDENVSVTFTPKPVVEHRQFMGNALSRNVDEAARLARANAERQAAAEEFTDCEEVDRHVELDPNTKISDVDITISCTRVR